ncbi:hypothetical protein LL037_03070 [Clostridium estertheticum]|uniref:Uncharacterized protein n=1 Tax=Clostridium estertheticum TaxID=238834 RepID=A0AA47EGE3_9CLOT|nr:hypothetical protein [Clostridium estertheticum]MBU3157536.1 hypothetical protein [Clostridium estertheticum]MBU3202328.1 hypothetical protein [Clostridium estertheticum]WAG59729.1 hypothetical protein LL038_19420 [Clostridium estertheticum]WAG66200.1 hypothetical protein LL037_03070 [Clostridium estertheticum]
MIFIFSAMLGLIQILEYSVEDAKTRTLLSYLKVALIFSCLGLTLGRAGF